jgi:hypothetical protein
MVAALNTYLSCRTLYKLVLSISDWGFAIVLTSFIAVQVGYQLDGNTNLSPLFIAGLFGVALLAGIKGLPDKRSGKN